MHISKIIQGCKSGKRHCQAALYDYSSDDIMNICLRYLGNQADAEDLLQDIYIRTFQKINSYDETKGAIGAWMARIAINQCLQFLRKKKNLVVLNMAAPPDELIATEDVLSDLSAQEIFCKVNNLPDGYRIVFNLFVVEGYKHVEIAEMLNISASSSRSQLARAKHALRKAITKNSNSSCYEKAE